MNVAVEIDSVVIDPACDADHVFFALSNGSVAPDVPVAVLHPVAPFDKSAQAACETTPAPEPLSAPVIVPAPPRAAASVPLFRLLALPAASVVATDPALDVTSPVSAGMRPAPSVPEEIFDAFVVSVVAEAAKLTPFVFVHVIAPLEARVQSPDVETDTHCVPFATKSLPLVAVTVPSAMPLILATVGPG